MINYDSILDNSALQDLITFLRFKSISTDTNYKDELISCAKWLTERLKGVGLSVILADEYKKPVIFAEKIVNPHNPTLLFYGHYDVQPAAKEDGWSTDPFDPTIKNNKIYARGSADNKSQIFAFIKALEYLNKERRQPTANIKILLEGEEEAGGDSLSLFIKDNKAQLQADVVISADAMGFGYPQPAIVYATRGIVYKEITIIGASKDLHSGSYGGIVPNPANILAWIIGKLTEPDGRINIPGFYDDVAMPSPEDLEEIRNISFDEEAICRDIGLPSLITENNQSPLFQLWFRPNLAVNGLVSGYTGKGAKTVIPSKASAKFSIRIVPHQQAKKISDLIDNYIKGLTPSTVKLDISTLQLAEPFYVERKSPLMNKIKELLETSFKTKAVIIREGATIPVLVDLKNHINENVILLGLSRPDCSIHGPNEYFHLDDLKNSVVFFIKLIESFKMLV